MTQSFFFTFGGGSAFAFEYIEIEAETLPEAADVMYNIFHDRWSMVYDELGFKDQPKNYGLHRLALIRRRDSGHFRSGGPGETNA